MKSIINLLFVYTIFTYTGFFTGCQAASPSYERVKALIWEKTIYFIYEDNNKMVQYKENYVDQPFNYVTDLDRLKETAREAAFHSSVKNNVDTVGIAKKVILERMVNAISDKLSSHENRKDDPVKLAKVDSLQRVLFQLIQEEYSEAQPNTQITTNTESTEDNNLQEGNSSLLEWIIIILLSVMLLLVIFTIWRMSKLMDRFAKKVKYVLEEREYQSSVSYSNQAPSFSQSEIQQLNSKLAGIQAETENIKVQISQLHTSMERNSPSPKEGALSENLFMSSFDEVSADAAKESHPVKEVRPTQFYAKKPNNNLFMQETLTTAPRYDSIYCIREETDGMATFFINNDEKVQNYALQNGGEMFLNEACEIQYQNNRPARITTDTPGKLMKEGKHWRIQEKARVILQ